MPWSVTGVSEWQRPQGTAMRSKYPVSGMEKRPEIVNFQMVINMSNHRLPVVTHIEPTCSDAVSHSRSFTARGQRSKELCESVRGSTDPAVGGVGYE